jgi:hypothetical protein
MQTEYTPLTDEQCDAFRRLPCGFNDMVRAIHKAGWDAQVVAHNAPTTPPH